MATLILIATVGIAFATQTKPAGADTVFQSGRRLCLGRRLGGVNVYDSSGNQLNSLDGQLRREHHRRQRLRLQRQLLRDRHRHRRHQRVRAGRNAHGGTVRHRAGPPALPRLRRQRQPLRRPAGHALHRRVQLGRAAPGRHRPGHHRAPGRRLDRPLERPVHLLLHDREHRHPHLQHVHPHAGPELQRGPVARRRPRHGEPAERPCLRPQDPPEQRRAGGRHQRRRPARSRTATC